MATNGACARAHASILDRPVGSISAGSIAIFGAGPYSSSVTTPRSNKTAAGTIGTLAVSRLVADTFFSRLDDASYTVKALGVLNGKLIFSVMPKLTADFVLVVGTDEFASADASTLEGDSISIIQSQWNHPGLDLSEGEEVAVRLAAPDDGTPATGLPVITGTARVGQTLTVDTSAIADEDGLDNVSYSYQWIRNDGTNDADIGGQTGSTYTLTDEDVGKSIKVRVSFTDDADHEETLTSAATGCGCGQAQLSGHGSAHH